MYAPEDTACEEYFLRKDAPLLTDVYCYECGRLVALSNAIQEDGRTYCPKCRGGEVMDKKKIKQILKPLEIFKVDTDIYADKILALTREGDEDWVELGNLREGAVFETEGGNRAVKSEYMYSNNPNAQCLCVLLESGEYAHFDKANKELVREVALTKSLEPQICPECGITITN